MRLTKELLVETYCLTKGDAWEKEVKDRQALVYDIMDRATDILNNGREGQILQPFQLEYLQCLRSRLQDHVIAQNGHAQEWLRLFNEAYAAG